jgi:aspartate-semialdehyde dehydrogenase
MNETFDRQNPIPVAVLGATGMVGQRFIQLLDGHPWFRVTALTGSERSLGKTYAEACRWLLPTPMPGWAQGLVLESAEPRRLEASIAFSALPSEAAREVEPEFAAAGCLVCSNASAFRNEPDVPILLPEVNPGHAGLVPLQRQRRGWPGAIVTNPNCTSTGMTVALKVLQEAFGLQRVLAVSMQALSGAGYPGVPSMDIIDNVIPYIGGEDEKVEYEPRKMLGSLTREGVEPAGFAISAQTNRVPVSEGHTVCLVVELGRRAKAEEAARAFEAYTVEAMVADLPSTPRPLIRLMQETDRPQPRLDRETGRGMTTVIGRLRPDTLFDLKLTVLSHNTIRGAAGGSIYNAELLVKQGLL